MKRIQIDTDLQQFLLARGVGLGESASSILRRELHLPPPPGTVEIDDDVYDYLVARMQAVGETASVILRRELHLPAPVVVPHPPEVIEFRIAAGTGTQAWNQPANPVVAHVGDTLRVVNDDSVPHELHTSGRPFPHPAQAIDPGQSMDFTLLSAFDPGHDGALTDHLGGPASQFFLEVRVWE